MAVRQIENWTRLKPEVFIGLSSDSKPTIGSDSGTLRAGSTFYELDTKNTYIFDGINVWKEEKIFYKDLGVIIDASTMAAGAIVYSSYFDDLEWVRNIICLSQSDQQYDLVYFRRDFNGNVDTSGQNIGTSLSAYPSPNWRYNTAISNVGLIGYSARFYIKNSSASPNTYGRLRVQLLAL